MLQQHVWDEHAALHRRLSLTSLSNLAMPSSWRAQLLHVAFKTMRALEGGNEWPRSVLRSEGREKWVRITCCLHSTLLTPFHSSCF